MTQRLNILIADPSGRSGYAAKEMLKPHHVITTNYDNRFIDLCTNQNIIILNTSECKYTDDIPRLSVISYALQSTPQVLGILETNGSNDEVSSMLHNYTPKIITLQAWYHYASLPRKAFPESYSHLNEDDNGMVHNLTILPWDKILEETIKYL